MPIIAGGLVVAILLPVFLAADWSLAGWVLGASLWLAGQVIGLVVSRSGYHRPESARVRRRRLRHVRSRDSR